MSNKKTTREQFKEMVTYLMEEGTDNSIIEGYTDTFMLIHNESQQPELRYNEEGEVDFYSNDLNTERIKKYKTVAKRYNIDEGSVRDIFSEGIYFAQYKMAQRIKELTQENEKKESLFNHASKRHLEEITTSTKLIKYQKAVKTIIESDEPEYMKTARIEAITIGKNQNT